MKKAIGIVVLGLLWYNVAKAEYYVKGHVPCGFILENKDDDKNKLMVVSWVNGYTTAKNYVTEDKVGENVDLDSTYHAVVKYCRDNPLKGLHNAAESIYFQMSTK